MGLQNGQCSKRLGVSAPKIEEDRRKARLAFNCFFLPSFLSNDVPSQLLPHTVSLQRVVRHSRCCEYPFVPPLYWSRCVWYNTYINIERTIVHNDTRNFRDFEEICSHVYEMVNTRINFLVYFILRSFMDMKRKAGCYRKMSKAKFDF